VIRELRELTLTLTSLCKRPVRNRLLREGERLITNTAGVVAVKLTCPTDPGDSTVLRASPPQNSAVRACRNYRIIGVCPAPVAGAADITGLWTAEFGVVRGTWCVMRDA
jgi:hypothetical protein